MIEGVHFKLAYQRYIDGINEWFNCEQIEYDNISKAIWLTHRRIVAVPIPLSAQNIKPMNKIPSQIVNPNGLHQRYYIQKIVLKDGNLDWADRSGGERGFSTLVKKPVDKDAEYFVMRLDEGGKDPEHIKACRIGVNAYADAIQHHLPELAKDLKERYPLADKEGKEESELAQENKKLHDKLQEWIGLEYKAQLEIERLKGLLIYAHDFGHNNGYYVTNQAESLKKFKTENNL